MVSLSVGESAGASSNSLAVLAMRVLAAMIGRPARGKTPG